MPYEFYKILHFVGLFTAIGAIFALIYRTWSEGDGAIKARRPIMIFHGIGSVILLVSGFGLLARLGVMGSWPLWVWIKLSTWVFIIVAPSIVMRLPASRSFMWMIFPLALFFAAFAVVYKLGV